MDRSRPSLHNIFRGLVCVAAVGIPLLLLVDPSATFPEDWTHHLWMVGYYGEYFRQHGDMPTVVNISGAVGIPQPVFYGYLFYPLLGLLSAVIGASLAVRVALLLVVSFQFWALWVAGRAVFRSRAMNYAVAASTIWGTYSLTNLYSRGALAEYFSVGATVAAVGFLVALLTEDSRKLQHLYGAMAVVLFTATVGTHPPTAILACAFGLLVGTVGLAARLRKHFNRTSPLLMVFMCLPVGLAMLTPWIYAAYSWAPKLAVSGSNDKFLFCLDRSDFWWGRLAPYPYDLSSTESGVDGFGAAYLEAPINIVLLIFLLWNFELLRRYRRSVRNKASGFRIARPPDRAVTWILGAAVCWFSLLLVISVSPAVAGLFQPLAPYVQYVYRLVSHCNLALLVAVFASGFMVAKQEGYRRFRRETQLVTAVGLTIAVLGVLLKLQHSGVLGKQSGTTELAFAGDRSRLVQKGRAQLAEAYYIPTLVKELPKQESLKVPIVAFPVESAGRRFGQPRPVEVQSKEAGWTVTNAVAFPWTELWVDGNKAPVEQLARQGQFFAILLPSGKHELEVKWRPDVAWMTLHRISQLVSVLAALGAMGLMGWLYRSRSRV